MNVCSTQPILEISIDMLQVVVTLMCHFSISVLVHADGPDNIGKEFYIAFLQNKEARIPNEIFLATMSNKEALVIVTTPKYDNTFREEVVVKRKMGQKVKVTAKIRGENTELSYKSVYIVSTENIVVICVNKEKGSTDGFLAFPADTASNDYYIVTYIDGPTFAVIGTAQNTRVSIKLAIPPKELADIHVEYDDRTYTNSDEIVLTINRFQVFHCFQDNVMADFTGTHVTSNRPVSVISGNAQSAVPNPNLSKFATMFPGKRGPPPEPGRTKDHLVESAIPLNAWGKKYFTYNTPERRSGDTLRILGYKAKTKVSITDESQSYSFYVEAGAFVELGISSGNLMTINARFAICVSIFSRSNKVDISGGDPAFSYLVSEEQFASSYTYSTVVSPGTSPFKHTLIIITANDNREGLVLNEMPLLLTWTDIPGSNGFGVAKHMVYAGTHNIYHKNPLSRFMAAAAGNADDNSYAFLVGCRLSPINSECKKTTMKPQDIIDNDCDGRIDEEAADGFDDDGDGEIDEDLALPPRVNGNWSEWSEYTECTVTCNVKGTMKRTRQCNNPAPANNGMVCVGKGEEVVTCDLSSTPCGEWQAWTSWSLCSATCDIGLQKRKRKCLDPNTLKSDRCLGDDGEQSKQCTRGPIKGTCYGQTSNGKCSYCDWGYSGAHCQWCASNFTDCHCKSCKTQGGCKSPCFHGKPLYSGGDKMCKCDSNAKVGYWQGQYCNLCMDGFQGTVCKDCKKGWLGGTSCSLPCQNGGTLSDLKINFLEIVPHYTCVMKVSATEHFAWVGYSNYNSKAAFILVGPDNVVDGATARQQETQFRPGFHKYAFKIGPILSDNPATWTLAFNSKHVIKLARENVSLCPPDVRKWNLLNVVPGTNIGLCRCAPGFYGASCQETCPGGGGNPCFRHGDCHRVEGTCTCQSRWCGQKYDYEYYLSGYKSEDQSYPCNVCTEDFIGPACSVTYLKGDRRGKQYLAVAFTTNIITLDGASFTLVQPGAYRLLETKDIVLDAFFAPCLGQFDCHTLSEVSLMYKANTISFSVTEKGETKMQSDLFDLDKLTTFRSEKMTVSRHLSNVLRVTFDDGTRIVVAKIGRELVLGVYVSEKQERTKGLLGNADGDWLNDISNSTEDTMSRDLSPSKIAERAEKLFKLSATDAILKHFNADELIRAGGHTLQLAGGSSCARVSGLPRRPMQKMSLELWTKVKEVTEETVVILATLATPTGKFVVCVENSSLTVKRNTAVFTSQVKLKPDSWTYVVFSWDHSGATVTLTTINHNGERLSESKPFFYFAKSISVLTLSFGGGDSNTPVSFDYIRLFNKIRTPDEMSDFREYIVEFKANQLVLILFDEGVGNSFSAQIMAVNGRVGTVKGRVKGGTWKYSTLPIQHVATENPLPPVIPNEVAVKVCTSELTSSRFADSNCTSNLGAIHQMVMEGCIRDFMRTKSIDIIKLSGSALAYYCYGMMQRNPCVFEGYFDFCQEKAQASATISTSEIMVITFTTSAGISALLAALICALFLIAASGRGETSEEGEEEELDGNKKSILILPEETQGVETSEPRHWYDIFLFRGAPIKDLDE